MGACTTGVLTLACCIPALGFAGGNPPRARYEFESRHMGVVFRIVLYAADEMAAAAAAKAAFSRVAELDRVMSDYNPHSELMRLCKANDSAPGVSVPVSRDLFDVLSKGQAVAQESGGAFDMTVGPIVQLWRIARRTQQLPDKEELKAALAKVGSEKMMLDPKTRTVTLKVPGMRLDLGGIGKGYAADAAMTVLRSRGFPRALVAAGGDVTTGDPPPGQEGWVVDIAPIGKGEPSRTLKLVNASVSTSGDLYQFVEIGGVRYSHVLDPRTGLGLTGRRSVSIVAPTGTQADSLTKAASVLSPNKALALVERRGAVAFIVVKEADDAPTTVIQSQRFAEFLP